MPTLAISFDARYPACPWDVKKDGELVAGFETRGEAEAFKAELEDEAAQFAELAAEELRAEVETERDNLIEDLCELADPSDLAELSIEELRAMASRIN